MSPTGEVESNCYSKYQGQFLVPTGVPGWRTGVALTWARRSGPAAPGIDTGSLFFLQ